MEKLNSEDLLLNQTVSQISFTENALSVKAETIFEGDSVVLALPPKLWANRIDFQPEISGDLKDIAL